MMCSCDVVGDDVVVGDVVVGEVVVGEEVGGGGGVGRNGFWMREKWIWDLEERRNGWPECNVYSL